MKPFQTTAFGLAILIVFANTASAQQKHTKPNILFIICDDLNTHVSSSGYVQIKTPNFDQLANNGMTFSRAFCQYPVCGPSRASILSGLYPQSTGVLDNKADIRQTRPGTISLPQLLKQSGYWTACVGKVFHSPRHEHGKLAWDEFYRFENDELPVVTNARKQFEQKHGSVELPNNRKQWKKTMKEVMAPLNAQTPPGHGPSGLRDEQHRDGKNARQVVQWLRKKSYGQKPFFISLGIHKPHVPFLAPEKYFKLYPREKITFHRDSPNLWDTIPRDALSGRYKAFGFELGKENDPRRREFMQAYHACVSFIDAQIGIVFEELKTQGLWENTIIILTSDHGYHLGDHFLWGKVTLFDIGARVPFIVRVPNLTKPGSRSEAMVELVDIYPTVVELSGSKTPERLHGTSLVPLLHDPTLKGGKAYAYSVVSRKNALGYAIRNQHWRYGKWPKGEELYDLKNDPHERNNLANDPSHRERLHELRTVLAERQRIAQNSRQKKQ